MFKKIVVILLVLVFAFGGFVAYRPAIYRIERSVVVKAPASGPERAKKQDAARKALAQLRAEEKKNQLAFVSVAREKSEDEATKGLGGDLNFRSKDELEKLYGKAAADAVFALKDNESSGLVESPQGFLILKVAGRQEAVEKTFEQVKGQISQKLYRERKTKEFDDFVKKLRETAAVKVNEAELEKIAKTDKTMKTSWNKATIVAIP